MHKNSDVEFFSVHPNNLTSIFYLELISPSPTGRAKISYEGRPSSLQKNKMKVLLPNVNVSTLLSSHFVDLSTAAEVIQEDNVNPTLIDQIEHSLNSDTLMSSDDVDDYLQRLTSEMPDETISATRGIQESLQNEEIGEVEKEQRNSVILSTKQEERKPALKEPLRVVRKQAPQKTPVRRNPTTLVRLNPPKTLRRTSVSHQANGSGGMIARGSRIRMSSNSMTVAQSPQQEWNRHTKQAIINTVPSIERVKAPENKSPVFGSNRNGMITPNQIPMINQRQPVLQSPIQHVENEYFVAVTHCRLCNGKKEHLLSRPGMWPPASCNYCGASWHIIQWKKFVCEDDDDIIYAGEVINTPKMTVQKAKRPVFYGSDGIKMEPKDEYDNVPQCLHCGGIHLQHKGQPYPPGYCPHYHGSFSGSNML